MNEVLDSETYNPSLYNTYLEAKKVDTKIICKDLINALERRSGKGTRLVV